jgi:hypothetical protein
MTTLGIALVIIFGLVLVAALVAEFWALGGEEYE